MSDSKVLIIGGHGQLGFELQRTAPRNLDVVAVGRPEIGITDFDSIERVVQRYQPDVMSNAAGDEVSAWMTGFKIIHHRGTEGLIW